MQIPIQYESGPGHDENERETRPAPEQLEELHQKAHYAEFEENRHEPETVPDNDAYSRLRADFENLKKRQEKAIKQGVEQNLGDFFKKFLSIYDDLERSLPYCRKSDQEVYEGMCLIYKRIEDLLKEKGVERIEAQGKPFDPNLHEAIMVEENSHERSNIVTAEIQPGYRFQGQLLRPATVTVSR